MCAHSVGRIYLFFFFFSPVPPAQRTMATVNRYERCTHGVTAWNERQSREKERKKKHGDLNYRLPLSNDSVFKRPYDGGGTTRQPKINGQRSNQTSIHAARSRCVVAQRSPSKSSGGFSVPTTAEFIHFSFSAAAALVRVPVVRACLTK